MARWHRPHGPEVVALAVAPAVLAAAFVVTVAAAASASATEASGEPGHGAAPASPSRPARPQEVVKVESSQHEKLQLFCQEYRVPKSILKNLKATQFMPESKASQ